MCTTPISHGHVAQWAFCMMSELAPGGFPGFEIGCTVFINTFCQIICILLEDIIVLGMPVP